ncbi:MAG: kinase/pyrophosphorylase [Rhodospirillales bacterium]|nr:kinase/pyrophosphorylase [Rhodospirillales bacterium]
MTDLSANGRENGEGTTIVLHMVSHASGEMVEMIARNAVAQLEGVRVERYLWKMVRNLSLLPDILAKIATSRGFVFHSIAATDIRMALEEGCEHLRVPCMFVLEPFVAKLAEFSGAPIHYRTAARDYIDEDYYRRVEAMKFTLAHDDGLASDHLDNADVVLVGVSRATKTPTCMYLASRGIKAANVPLVPDVPLPEGLLAYRNKAGAPLVVGLTVRPQVLADIRSARLKRLSEDNETVYSEIESVAREVTEARRLCLRQGWKIIDVTGRPIENTAAIIIDLLRERGMLHDLPSDHTGAA